MPDTTPSVLLRRSFLIGLPLVSVLTVITAHFTAAAMLPNKSSNTARVTLPVPITHDKTILGALPNGSFLPATSNDGQAPLATNTWWTGALDAAWPTPLFAWPLTVSFSPTGALIDAPGAKAAGKAVMYETKDPIRIFSDEAATSAAVTDHGDWDVTVSVKNKEKKNLFEVTALQGSPFVFIASKVSHLSFALPQGSTVTELSCSNPCASALQVTAKNRTYLVLSDQKKGLAMNGAQMEATFASTGGKLTVAVVAPQTKVEDYLPYAFTTMNGTKASFAVGTESITTTFQFPAETLIGILPHQFASLTKEPSKLLGTYDTVRGPIRLYKGKSFQTTVQKPAILPGIPPVKADKDALATLKKDIQDAKPGDGDVYWQGKNLLKIANLAQVADSMGDTTSRATAVKKAKDILADWCTASKGETSKYFGYDTRAGGIVALPQGFGSEHFNDHHFHYGYFIHAAAIVNQLDPKFDSEYGDCIRLLIKDIANVDRSDKSFPYLRHFDAYAGHSWAGGLTTFADGNNQESTSEALQAWYAMALYGRVTGNKTLEEQGLWLWSQESLGAKTYWLNSTKNSGVFPKDFAYPMASIVWGGKYDYATFFDGSDGAVRGIQFFPFTPALFTVLDKATVTRLMTPLVSKEANGIWKTGAMFYDALFNPKSAKVLLSPLDSVYSDSYLQQWLTISKSIGVPVTPLPSCNGWIFSGSKGSSVVVFRKKSDASLCEFSANGKKVVKKDIKERWNVLGI